MPCRWRSVWWEWFPLCHDHEITTLSLVGDLDLKFHNRRCLWNPIPNKNISALSKIQLFLGRLCLNKVTLTELLLNWYSTNITWFFKYIFIVVSKNLSRFSEVIQVFLPEWTWAEPDFMFTLRINHLPSLQLVRMEHSHCSTVKLYRRVGDNLLAAYCDGPTRTSTNEYTVSISTKFNMLVISYSYI
jgi:hypothetical protein